MKTIDTARPALKKQAARWKTSIVLPQAKYDGKLSGILGVSNQQFRFLTRNLPIGLGLFRVVYNQAKVPVDFVCLEVNPEFTRVMGVSREKMLDKAFSEVYSLIRAHPADWLNVLIKATSSGEPEHVEIRAPQNHKFYRVYVFSPTNGYCIIAFMDVEKRKEDKQKRISAEKLYRRLYETTQDGIMARDLQGRMLNCNKAYARMLGYTKKELKKLSVKQLIPEKWLEQREKVAAKVIETGRSIVFEREYRRKDGVIFPASVRTWQLIDEKGKVTGIWSIVRDISEQKALQKDLEKHAGMLEQIIEERTKQLKDNERLVTIGQTAGMVGHDLRNPLQTIIGELFLAKKDVEALADGDTKSNLQESIQVIEDQAAYMDKIVSDLQAFVQPVKIDKKPIELKDLISNVLESVAMPPDVLVKTQIQNEIPQMAVDPQLLKRVLINLVTNAVQAMPSGGKLCITAKIPAQNQVSISVRDSGVGIPEAIKKQLFTPLFTTKSRGQGFGLPVCKRVIEAHGGSINFESTEGQGAEFTIQFPIT